MITFKYRREGLRILGIRLALSPRLLWSRAHLFYEPRQFSLVIQYITKGQINDIENEWEVDLDRENLRILLEEKLGNVPAG